MHGNNGRRYSILEALLALALGLLIMALTGCGAGSSAGAPQREQESGIRAASSHAGNFAGKVEGTEAFVAVVVDKEDRALAYVCDGREGETADVAEWFRGAVAGDGSLDLTGEGGAGLSAEVADGGVSGTVTLGGEEHAFSAEPAEEPAGLYRKVKEVGGEEYVGGWIELPSGEERGAVRNTSSGFIDPLDDLARPSRPVSGFMESDIEF